MNVQENRAPISFQAPLFCPSQGAVHYDLTSQPGKQQQIYDVSSRSAIHCASSVLL